MKLTAAYVKNLRATRKRQEIPHDDPKRLVLRVSVSGAKSWAVRYSFRGRDVRYDLGPCNWDGEHEGLTLGEARQAALEILTRVGRGEDPQAEKQAAKIVPQTEPVTVEKLCREALAKLVLRPATRQNYEQALKRVLPKLGHRPAESVTRREIREWAEDIAAKTPALANLCFAFLRRCWSLGVQRDLVTATPFVGLNQPARSNSSDRVLSAGELWALLASLEGVESQSADVVRLLLFTGVRMRNVLGARESEFHDLDSRDPRWLLPADRMKGNRQHVVPLSPQAVKVVKGRLQDGPYLFRWHSIQKWGGRQAERIRARQAKLLGQPVPQWSMHNLRHTLATHHARGPGRGPGRGLADLGPQGPGCDRDLRPGPAAGGPT